MTDTDLANLKKDSDKCGPVSHAAECRAWRELYVGKIQPGERDTTDERGALERQR